MSSILSNPEILNNLLDGENLDDSTSRSLMQRWLNDEISDVQTGAFLGALRAKVVLVLSYVLWLKNF